MNTLEQRYAYAQTLATSDLIPKAYRGKPANVLVAMDWGQAVGLQPMTAINGLTVIDGTPTAKSSIIAALVQRAGHKLRVTSGPDRSRAVIVRSDDPDHEHTAEWTLEKARQARLITSINNGHPVARDYKGSPLPWERYTEAMLVARAITEVARKAAQDALHGLMYTPEELGVVVTEEGEPVIAPSGDPVIAEIAPAPHTPSADWVDLAQHAPDMPALHQVWRDARSDGADDTYLRILADAGHQRRTQLEAHEAMEEHDIHTPELTAA